MKKMTKSIDEALLARVMRLTGLKTKTETVEFALREAERTSKLTQLLASPRKDEDHKFLLQRRQFLDLTW